MFQAGCGTEKYLKQHFSRWTQILWYNLVARTRLVLSILIVSNVYMTKKTFTFSDEQWLISLIIDSFSQKQTCHLHQLYYREIASDIHSHSSNQRLCTLKSKTLYAVWGIGFTQREARQDTPAWYSSRSSFPQKTHCMLLVVGGTLSPLNLLHVHPSCHFAMEHQLNCWCRLITDHMILPSKINVLLSLDD